ncbi:MAG: glycerol-3-phosphate 1-O-acyltransferase PlsY [Actinobacteria bacterium]|nr:glycerol-3-phosphate 1-O-acyltransferase PlsY [Actinomycetota bacterium]
MEMALRAVLWIAASYVLGSIPFGLVVSKLKFHQDLRELGSGNIGATNVLRNFGARAFVAVMIMDMAKGVAAVAVGRALGLGPSLSLLAGLASIIGHNWSLFLRFKGGKGIATSGGVIIAAYPWQVSVAVVGVFLVMVLLTRIMSVGSISAAVAFPVSTFLVLRADLNAYWPHLAVSCLAAAFALYKHRENMGRLAKGEEPRVRLKRPKEGEAGS